MRACGDARTPRARRDADAELAARLAKLRVGEAGVVKLLPERAYSVVFHPSADRLLVAAGADATLCILANLLPLTPSLSSSSPSPASAAAVAVPTAPQVVGMTRLFEALLLRSGASAAVASSSSGSSSASGRSSTG